MFKPSSTGGGVGDRDNSGAVSGTVGDLLDDFGLKLNCRSDDLEYISSSLESPSVTVKLCNIK